MAPPFGGGSANNTGPNRSTRPTDFQTSAGHNSINGGTQSSRPIGTTIASAHNGWGGPSIWGNNNTLASHLGASSRDRSATRETSASLANGTEDIEPKMGSSALLGSHENYPAWGRTTGRPLNAQPTPGIGRSADVSPSRQRPWNQHSSVSEAPRSQMLPQTRPGGLGYDRSRIQSLQVNSPTQFPNDVEEADPRSELAKGFGGTQRSRSLYPGLGDGSAVRSPTDERTVSDLGYFQSSSATQSTNGSQPGSRHGNDPPSFPTHEAFARFAAHQGTSTGVPRNPSSSTNSIRSGQQRTNSFPTDLSGSLKQLSVNGNYSNGVNAMHRQRVSDASLSSFAHQAIADGMQSGRTSLTDDDQVFDLNGGSSHPSHTPEGLPYSQLAAYNWMNANNAPRFDHGALTPVSSEFRPSPFTYSTAATPPLPSASALAQHLAQARNAPNSVDLQHRLHSLAQHHPQNFMNAQLPTTYAPPRYPNAYNQFNQYPYQLANANAFTGMSGPMAMPALNYISPEGSRGRRDFDGAYGFRSPVLEDFKNNNKGKRWELRDLLGHAVEFAGDQYGSRFIQSKLQEANSEAKHAVFLELQENALQLMKDVFGNYVIQRYFEHGDQNQKHALGARMKGKVFDLSKQMYGCRVVQKAVEHVLVDQQAALVAELNQNGHVMTLVKDQNGNHVIQKAIECVPARYIQFIYDTFRGQIGSLSSHSYGCRVIQRMLENCTGPERVWLLEELRGCAPSLVTDQYGNYVVQHMIGMGAIDDRNYTIDLVTQNLVRNSTHKFASNVVEKCFMFGTTEQKRTIMHIILKDANLPAPRETTLQALIKDQYGNYVIQKLLDHVDRPDFEVLCEALQVEISRAKRAGTHGKQITAIERHMFRPDASDEHEPATTSGASPTQAPALTDTQSVRSDSVPSTTMSNGNEPITAVRSDKLPAIDVPRIGITDITE